MFLLTLGPEHELVQDLGENFGQNEHEGLEMLQKYRSGIHVVWASREWVPVPYAARDVGEGVAREGVTSPPRGTDVVAVNRQLPKGIQETADGGHARTGKNYLS